MIAARAVWFATVTGLSFTGRNVVAFGALNRPGSNESLSACSSIYGRISMIQFGPNLSSVSILLAYVA